MRKLLNFMKTIYDVYMKISENEVAPFLQCYLEFKNPLNNIQYAYEATTSYFENSNRINQGKFDCTESYTYYGLKNGQTCMTNSPFETRHPLPIILTIERIGNKIPWYANLSIKFAPIWTDDETFTERYLLVSSSKRKYNGYMMHITHPTPNTDQIWCKYLNSIISYVNENQAVDSCRFVYKRK